MYIEVIHCVVVYFLVLWDHRMFLFGLDKKDYRLCVNGVTSFTTTGEQPP